MRFRLTTCARLSLALALAAGAGCGGDHTGVPASPPFDPIGSEPAGGGGGGDAPAGTNVLAFLCAESCAKGDKVCPGFSSGGYCARFCVMSLSYYPGCEAEYLSQVSCQAGNDPVCFGGPYWQTCDGALQALNACLVAGPPPSPEDQI
jgi:hypothetical protein